MGTPILQARGLTKTYQTPILNNLDVDILKGQFIAITIPREKKLRPKNSGSARTSTAICADAKDINRVCCVGESVLRSNLVSPSLNLVSLQLLGVTAHPTDQVVVVTGG